MRHFFEEVEMYDYYTLLLPFSKCDNRSINQLYFNIL